MKMYKSLPVILYRVLIFFIALIFSLFSQTMAAFALDYSVVEGESNGWTEIRDVTLYESGNHGFDGTLKTMTDNEGSCFYIFFQLNDYKIENTDTENIAISFRLKNNGKFYSFSINENGFYNTADDVADKVEICYNFDQLVSGRSFAVIYAGFEISDKQMRNHDTEVEGFYNCLGQSEKLFDNKIIKGVGVKTETKRKTTTKKSQTSGRKPSDSGSTKKKKSSATEKSTKFVPGKHLDDTVSRYEPVGNMNEQENGYDNYGEDENSALAKDENLMAVYPLGVKVSLALGAVIVVFGLALILSALMINKNKKHFSDDGDDADDGDNAKEKILSKKDEKTESDTD